MVGLASLQSSCVVDAYGPVAVNGPGYYGPYGPYGPYGEPYFVYGGINYYTYGGRYYYVDHGRRVYVHQLPSGGHYYHSHGGYSGGQTNLQTTRLKNNPYNKTNYSNNKLNYLNTNRGQQFSGSHGTPTMNATQNPGKQPTKTLERSPASVGRNADQ